MLEGHIREKFVYDARNPEAAYPDRVIGVTRITFGRARIVIGPADKNWYDDTW